MEDTAGTDDQDIKMPAIPEEVSMLLSWLIDCTA